ncbi:translational GTPase TypA, partial [Myxococcota bacterium]|nr:translational GTPase TypA [Myxococcota bacterium]
IDMDVPGTDLQPLVKILTDHVPAPADHSDEPFLMQVNSLSYDDYVGRLVIGRIRKGGLKVNDHVFTKGKSRDGKARIAGLFTFQGVERIPLKEGKCGDIVAIAGIEDIDIGDTLSAEEKFEELAPIAVDEPTVAMVFQVNDGPLSGKSGGKFLTSRHIKERLEKEAYSNVSIHILPGEEANQFRVLGRGELQLAVLIESMRREKFEFCVRNPEVVTRQGEAGQEEPTERLSLDVPIEHLGAVNELLGKRKAKLIDQRQEGSRVRLLFIIPTRGLLGLRGIMLTTTRGTAISNSVFEGWIPWTGPIPRRTSGAVIADRAGTATPYAIFHMQPRGSFFIPNGTTIYEGMIIGEHNRSTCLNVNATREKKQTNVRASGKDDAILLT